jgi:hypothetical protein
MRIFILPFFVLLSSFPVWSQTTIDFSIKVPADLSGETVGVRGDMPPLSWDSTYVLSPEGQEGFFSGSIALDSTVGRVLEYKYVVEDKEGKVLWELENEGNRLLVLSSEILKTGREAWNEMKKIEVTDLPRVPADGLLEDFEILREALTSLHPGLYRYNSEAAIEMHFAKLREAMSQPLTYAEAYKEISKFLGRIRCGHTYANFFNQDPLIREVIFGQLDKFPFAFRIIDGKMIVTENASNCKFAEPGTEILTINGIPVERVLDSLMTVVKGDGSNHAKRLKDLEVYGYNTFEAFDAYFPLLFPPQEYRYSITAAKPKTKQRISCIIAPLNRTDRNKLIRMKGAELPESYDDLWAFNVFSTKAAYMRLGTFVTWEMDMDWKQFLADAFGQLNEKKTPSLIIDIRGNEGGLDEVGETLIQYLLKEEARYPTFETRTRYEVIPESLRPYLDTWDKSIYDIKKQMKSGKKGFFIAKGEKDEVKLVPSENPYQGKVYLLVDADNSSSTFYLAKMMKELGLATLVGQTTGGNLRGLNGGNTVFLRLPNSRIEVDIPLLGAFAREEMPDEGVKPDIVVKQSVEDLIEGKDAVLEYVKKKVR